MEIEMTWKKLFLECIDFCAVQAIRAEGDKKYEEKIYIKN